MNLERKEINREYMVKWKADIDLNIENNEKT